MRKAILSLLLSVLIFATACGAPATAAPSPTPPPPMPTEAPPAKITIYYEENAQVELISLQGVRVLIDISDPTQLSSPVNEKDILLITHLHDDHYNRSFVESFPGQVLKTQVGELQGGDVSILGITSAHNEGSPFKDKGGSNYIYRIDMDGLRIAHFGDIGQEALTPEQLETLGQVDIAITQFVNSFSAMNTTNRIGFNLMNQLKPRLIIPTHNSRAGAEMAVQQWAGFYTDQPSVTIDASRLPQTTTILFMGFTAKSYGTLLKLEKFQ